MEEDHSTAKSNEPKPTSATSAIKSVFVPGEKQLEYIVHISNRDFLARLPKVLIPKKDDKYIRAFELTADDMHDNFHGINLGDLVFGKKMNAPHKFKKGKVYVAVTREKVIIRRAKPKKEFIEFVPDNSNFDAIEVSKGEIIEAWEVIGYFSEKIDAPTLITERIMHLENQIDMINDRLGRFEKNQQ